MNAVFPALVTLAVLLFSTAPLFIAWAPYESTMGLVQKIFYYHAPSAWLFLISVVVAGWMSGRFLISRRPIFDQKAAAAAELAAIFGTITLLTGPLWARKAWGVYWQWDARLTSSLVLWMIMLSYALLRRYGGPGSERLSAALALFGLANVPFVYWSVNMWRTVHPLTTVVPSLPYDMSLPFWWSLSAFFALYLAMFMARVRLEAQRARLDALYLELED